MKVEGGSYNPIILTALVNEGGQPRARLEVVHLSGRREGAWWRGVISLLSSKH